MTTKQIKSETEKLEKILLRLDSYQNKSANQYRKNEKLNYQFDDIQRVKHSVRLAISNLNLIRPNN